MEKQTLVIEVIKAKDVSYDIWMPVLEEAGIISTGQTTFEYMIKNERTLNDLKRWVWLGKDRVEWLKSEDVDVGYKMDFVRDLGYDWHKSKLDGCLYLLPDDLSDADGLVARSVLDNEHVYDLRLTLLDDENTILDDDIIRSVHFDERLGYDMEDVFRGVSHYFNLDDYNVSVYSPIDEINNNVKTFSFWLNYEGEDF